MAGEIFISYRRADKAWAELLHQQLKAEGADAWFDALVEAGEDWRLATANALEGSKIFVLLFSENAAESSDIAKELAAAVLEKKQIVPIRLQNIAPKGAFLYELASRNWINAYENTELRLAEVAKGLARMVQTGVRSESALPFDRTQNGKLAAQRKWLPAVAAAIVVAIASALLLYFTMGQHDIAQNKAHPIDVAGNTTPPSQVNGVSIAVLPFQNLSSDKDQEFFSDGMTDEITSALAKVPGLSVIGRSSAFQYKGANRDLRTIGRALGVKNLIDGSVRKDGDQVRITAALVRVSDGTQLWTESYDRQLKGIFAVQEDIATAIAGALQVPLGLKQGQSLVANRTADTTSYQDYLRARTLLRNCRCLQGEVTRAITLLEQVVSRDSNFAPAWGLLAMAYGSSMKFSRDLYRGSPEDLRRLVQSVDGRMEMAANNAIRLDQKNTDGYAALGDLARFRGNWVAGEDYYRKALMLDPADDNAIYGYIGLLQNVGKIEEAERRANQLLALEPLTPQYNALNAVVLLMGGHNDEAIKILEAGGPTPSLAEAYATAGRYGDAADTLIARAKQVRSNADLRQSLEDAAKLMRSAPARAANPAALPALWGELGFVYLFVGAESRSLEFVERGIAAGYFHWTIADVWGTPSTALRKTPQFKGFARKAALVDYWRARGWPKFCHSVGADDFACH